MLDPVVKVIDVPCNRQTAFDIFVADINSWWPLDKNSVSAMGGNAARSLKLESKVGGSIVETGHDGTEHLWGSVKEYNPPDMIALNWHIGLPDTSASLVEVRFTEVSANETRVELIHSNWEVFGDKADDMRNGYNAGWVGVFEQAYFNACCGVTS